MVRDFEAEQERTQEEHRAEKMKILAEGKAASENHTQEKKRMMQEIQAEKEKVWQESTHLLTRHCACTPAAMRICALPRLHTLL